MANYYKGNPIKSKHLARDMQNVFCRTYADKIRFAVAVNSGTNTKQLFKIAGRIEKIILN